MNAIEGATEAELLELLDAIEELEEEARRNPLAHIAWLPGQLAWLSDPGPRPKLFRAGVRSGKTTAAAGEVIFRALGHHPYNRTVRRAPQRCAVITTDKQAQGVQIMRLFDSLVPQHELLPGIEFSSRTGYRGHVPVVSFANGSEVTWYSNASGPRALQGSEYDYIQIDEPCSEELFYEALARVRNTSGQVGITLTPLHLPVPWLQDLCNRGMVTDHHYKLSVTNQTSPITGRVRRTKTGVPWDEAFIEALRAEDQTPSQKVKLDGEWEARSEGQWFDIFNAARHVVEHIPGVEMHWYLGLDYSNAQRELGMTAVLSGVVMVEEESFGLQPHIWTLDEVVMPGTATMDQFAAAILKMLLAHGFEWHELTAIYGDNPVKARHEEHSSTELQKRIARRLGLAFSGVRPKILSAKEGGAASGRARRTKDVRCTWMYNQLAHDRVRVHARCTHLRKGLESWDYGDRHPYKDVLDGWMYALREQWASKREQAHVPRVHMT